MSRFYENNIFERVRYSVSIEDTVRNLLPNGKKQGNEWVSLNPIRHDGRPGSFKVNLSTGRWADFASEHKGRDIISLYSYLNHVSSYKSAQELLGEYRVHCHTPSRQDDSKTYDSQISYISKILSECINPKGTLVEKYLLHRCIVCKLPISIYYHPCLYHALTKKNYPAMVSVIIKYPAQVIGIHRTYLSHDGTKADIEPNKMILGGMNGGGVHLNDYSDRSSIDTSHIIIAEGIETGLSLYQATGKYVIASLSASNMANVVLPSVEEVNSVTIAVDNDEAGRRAGTNTATKLLNLGYSNVRITKSHIDDMNDFNDLLRR